MPLVRPLMLMLPTLQRVANSSYFAMRHILLDYNMAHRRYKYSDVMTFEEKTRFDYLNNQNPVSPQEAARSNEQSFLARMLDKVFNFLDD